MRAEAGVTKRASREVVGAITSVITDVLATGKKVTLVGFGTFQVINKKARRGVNPRTRESINIPAKKVARFKPGKSLREAIR